MGSVVATIGGRQSQVPAGTRLGRYRVVRRIASGGMCEVYLARAEGESGFARPVALKLVLPHLVEEASFTDLLEREAKLAAYLNHPNIVQTFELGREGDELYIAMEYVHGRTLREVLEAADGPLPLDVALSILVATCTALHTAHCATGDRGHQLGVVHRDISPSNVMLRYDGVVKVVDFGIAKAMTETTMTKTGTLKGKSGYMSPEQCRGADLTPASDIFNLGILLYETTTGRRAFAGANIFETMNRIVDGRYKRAQRIDPAFPRTLASIIDRTLSDDPNRRPVSGLSLRQELEGFAHDAGLTLSDVVVQRWMESRFGTTAPVDLGPGAFVDAPKRSSAATRARAFNWAGAAVIGALAGSIAFVALGRNSQATSSAPPAPSTTPAATAAPIAPAAPAVAAARPRVEEASASVIDDAVEAANPHPPSAGAAPEVAPHDDASAPAEPKKKPRKRRTTKAKPSKAKSKRTKRKAAGSDEPLFPWAKGQ